MRIITDNACTQYACPGHPERPQRIARTVEKLKSQKELSLTWESPPLADDAVILRAHSQAHLDRLLDPEDFDGDTPSYPAIAEHARRSVGGALRALESACNGTPAFNLLRPPGHHATPDRAMGFCYLNQIAIASLEAVARGFKKVAVYDFDVHHGNGTESILLDRPGCAFFSIHQFPCYPGTGGRSIRNCHNYPVQPGATRKTYRAELARALEDLKLEKPDLVAVSAGFDAYRGDPLAQEPLEEEDFYWLGEAIRKINIPHFASLEGGYSGELPELIFAFLKGLEGR
ncbi:MAG: histone deacetylase family protein [Verrucomicrobia bacterium]|nr:histone deacetylase family protein [Verrucomicrobiota bacterium]